MNIQISNLDQNTTEEQLTRLFSQHGHVKAAQLVRDVFTGQPRGLALIEMSDEADAQNAISQLNDSELDGRAISVEAATPKVEHKGSYPVGNSAYKTSSFQRSYGHQKKRGRK